MPSSVKSIIYTPDKTVIAQAGFEVFIFNEAPNDPEAQVVYFKIAFPEVLNWLAMLSNRL